MIRNTESNDSVWISAAQLQMTTTHLAISAQCSALCLSERLTEGDQIISTVCKWKYDWKQLSKFGLQVDGKGSKRDQCWHQLDGEEPALKTPGREATPAAYWKTQAKAGKPQAVLARAADRPKRQPGPFFPYYQQKLSCMPYRLSHTTYNLNG